MADINFKTGAPDEIDDGSQWPGYTIPGPVDVGPPQITPPAITPPAFRPNLPTTTENLHQPATTAAGDAQGDYIRQLYRQYLGREAGAHEIDQWRNNNQAAQAIMSSAESLGRWVPQWYQQYLGRTPSQAEVNQWVGTGSYQAAEHGIRTSAEATQRGQQSTTAGGTTGGGTNTGGTQTPPGGNFQQWFLGLTNGKTPTPAELEAMAPTLAQYGVKLGPRNARGFIDTIILPDGSAWDVIESATATGGKRWQWIPAGGGSGSGGGGTSFTTPGLPGIGVPGNQFNDPYSMLLEQILGGRINELFQPVSDAMRQQYGEAMQRRANALSAAEPQYQQLLDFLQKRFEELQGPGYTGAENEVLRTQALDPVERDRTAAKQRMTEQLAARGITPDSGIFQDAMRQVDQAFDGIRAQQQTGLASQELARREDRSQRAAQIGGTLVDIPQARAREQLDVFAALEGLSRSVRAEEEARRREAITYAGALADLPVQRLQLALQALGQGGNPDSMFRNLLGVAGLNQNAALMNQQQSAGLWSGLGSIAAILAAGGGGGGGQTYGPPAWLAN